MIELINMIKYQLILVYYSRLIYLWNSVYLLASFHWKAMHCNVKRTIRWFTELSVRSTWQLDFSIYFICIIVSNVNCDNNTTRWLTKGGRKSPVFWTTETITQKPEVQFLWNFAWWVAFWCNFRKCWVLSHLTSMEAVLEYHPFSWKKVYETYLCTTTTHCVKLEPQKMQWPLSNG